MVILASGFLGLQYILSKNQVSTWNNYLGIEAANTAVSTLTKELRGATNSGNGGYPLASLLDNEIIFYSDYDYDGQIERIRYVLNGNTLSKGIIEPVGDPTVYSTTTEKVKIVSDIIRNGTNSMFTYYNNSWPNDTTNNPLVLAKRISDTRLVKVYLKANPKTTADQFDYIVESEVRIRMLD
jgi:hypothetical protein